MEAYSSMFAEPRQDALRALASRKQSKRLNTCRGVHALSWNREEPLRDCHRHAVLAEPIGVKRGAHH